MPEVSRSLGVSEQTYYRWRKEYGGLKLDRAKRLKELERENARLRQAVADLTLDDRTGIVQAIHHAVGCGQRREHLHVGFGKPILIRLECLHRLVVPAEQANNPRRPSLLAVSGLRARVRGW